MITRKVAKLISPGKIEIVEEKIEFKQDEVLIKNLFCGLCSWEVLIYKGKLDFKLPHALGHEPVGIVENVGSKVTEFKKGDRVTGLYGPGFATYSVGRPTDLIKIPDNVKTEHALGEPLTCIINIVRAGQVEPGDYVLILGCGFMGLVAMSILKHFPVRGIIGVDVSDYKLNIARQLGADYTFNIGNIKIEDEINKITNGHGIDVALECTGKAEGMNLLGKLMRRSRGRLLIVTSHSQPIQCDLLPWEEKGIIVIPAHPSYSLNIKDDLRRAILCLEKGYFLMEKLITHKFRLEEVQKAFSILTEKPEDYIKGIITFD